MPCRDFEWIQANNSNMAHSYHFKLTWSNIFNFEHARFQMSLAASGYWDLKKKRLILDVMGLIHTYIQSNFPKS